MTEHVLASVNGREIQNITPFISRTSRLHVEGFSPWQRRWLMALIAVQITCEKLLLVDDAFAMRKIIERRKRSWLS